MDLGFEGRRVLIVGGSSGIGLASASLFAQEKADVLIVSRSAENLARAADRVLAESGAGVATAVADVTDAGAGDVLAGAVGEHWGGLDVLVTAVGGSIRAEFSALSEEDWLGNYNFNVLSAVRAIRALLPASGERRQPGHRYAWFGVVENALCASNRLQRA